MMNSSLENKSELPIKAKYWTESGIIAEGDFDYNITLGQLLDYYKKTFPNSLKVVLDKYEINGKIIPLYEPVTKLIHVENNSILESAEIWIELAEGEERIEKEFEEPLMKKLIKPKCNPFGLIVFIPSQKRITVENYPESITKKYGLGIFDSSSAYCDSPNALFISGGKKRGNPTNDFWIIDHEKYHIKYKKMPCFKSNHSMLYLNEELVLIAGGEDPTSFYYDIKKDEFITCGNFNEIHLQPALYRYKDYIYCFPNLENGKEYFERNSVTRFSGKWEKIIPFYSDKKTTKFYNKFYGVSSTKSGDLLLLGGKNKCGKTYLYNPKKNFLTPNEETDEIEELLDKRFYKISNYLNAAIPRNFLKNQVIAITDIKKKSCKNIIFQTSACDFNNFEKCEIEDDNKENETIGKISINATLKKKLFDNQVTIKDIGGNTQNIFNGKDEELRNTSKETCGYPRFSVPSLRTSKGRQTYEYFD